MFGLFTRKPRRAVPTSRRTRLWLENLETRDCPSAPTINLGVSVNPGHRVVLSGATSEGGMSVSFTGAVTGSTTSQSNGAYSYATNTANLGVVYAQGTDSGNNQTNVASGNVSVASPNLTMSVVYANNSKNVTLSGKVTDIDAAGLTITFSGEVTGTCTTQSGGTYSFTAAATALGNVTATTVDLWGLASNQASVTLACSAPTISNFTASEGPIYWNFSGTVTDQSPNGITVTLGGLPELNNVNVTTTGMGSFTYTVKLAVGESGTATAMATDFWGLTSNTATAAVDPT